jgi:hypothetical protein
MTRMHCDSQPGEPLREVIQEMSNADLVRLKLASRVLDPRRSDDLLQEAITRTLSGDRVLRDGIPLFWHLYKAMQSIAWDWNKKLDEKLLLESDFAESETRMSVFSSLASVAPDPERQAAARIDLSRVTEACKSDSLVSALLTSKLLGKTESEIRRELNLNEQDFNAAAQRLRRSAKNTLGLTRYA